MLTRVRESMPPGLSSLLKIKPVGEAEVGLAMTEDVFNRAFLYKIF
jgi:hypothetical protein